MMVAGMVLVRRWNERRMVNEEMNLEDKNCVFYRGRVERPSFDDFDFVGKKSGAAANRIPCHQTSLRTQMMPVLVYLSCQIHSFFV